MSIDDSYAGGKNRFIFYLMLTIVYPMGMKNNVESYMNLCLHFMNNENSFGLKTLYG